VILSIFKDLQEKRKEKLLKLRYNIVAIVVVVQWEITLGHFYAQQAVV